MKTITRALLVVATLILALPTIGMTTDIEWFGALSGYVGAERETGSQASPSNAVCTNIGCGFEGGTGGFMNHSAIGKAGFRGQADALGVIPLAGPLGAQISFNYTGGLGSRFATVFGPIYDFNAGKAGLFASYQRRTARSSNFWFIQPAVDLYFDQMNVSFRYIQPLSGRQEKSKGDDGENNCYPCTPDDLSIIDIPINKLQGTVSYFIPSSVFGIPKNNIEITLGMQVNSFWGYQPRQTTPEHLECNFFSCMTVPRRTSTVGGVGVGPVFGVSVMPIQNVELTLFKGTVDSASRYQIQSGVRLMFNKGNGPFQKGTSPSLLDLRRKYMEASVGPVSTFSAIRPTSSLR
jgi:hypothetical protein